MASPLRWGLWYTATCNLKQASWLIGEFFDDMMVSVALTKETKGTMRRPIAWIWMKLQPLFFHCITAKTSTCHIFAASVLFLFDVSNYLCLIVIINSITWIWLFLTNRLVNKLLHDLLLNWFIYIMYQRKAWTCNVACN